MEGKFTDKVILLKRDLWQGDKVYKIDFLLQSKMTGTLIENYLCQQTRQDLFRPILLCSY